MEVGKGVLEQWKLVSENLGVWGRDLTGGAKGGKGSAGEYVVD